MGDKLHLITRRLFEGDVRRHFVGTVVDARSAAPLEGARATLVELGAAAATDEDGRFRLADIPAGTHQLRVQMIGYRPVERTVQVLRSWNPQKVTRAKGPILVGR